MHTNIKVDRTTNYSFVNTQEEECEGEKREKKNATKNGLYVNRSKSCGVLNSFAHAYFMRLTNVCAVWQRCQVYTYTCTQSSGQHSHTHGASLKKVSIKIDSGGASERERDGRRENAET